MHALFKHQPCWYHYVVLCVLALVIRGMFFGFYVQHEERYRQPDTMDYHLSAWSLKQGLGLRYLDRRPIFWRTPAYPLFLSYFFNAAQRNPHFSLHTVTHKKILWVQIALCSCLPVLAGLLANVLTGSPPIVWATAIFSVFHTGYVLSSMYLLTDGIAALLLILFLICLFCVVQFPGDIKIAAFECTNKQQYLVLLVAALALSAYTWMRPMGQFVSLLAFFILLIGAGKTWRASCARASFFLFIFIITIMPWFVRNYRWTGQVFFCPLFGLYLNVFNAPKILARTANIPLEKAHAHMVSLANKVVNDEHRRYLCERLPIVICTENLCFGTAWSVIKGNLGYFAYDWTVEVLKTTFDLYASQLVALANNCFSWDPLVEYLPEKLYDCVYGKPMPLLFRLLAWLEALLYVVLWAGIFGGMWCFLVRPLFYGNMQEIFSVYGYLWIKCGLFIGMVVGQSGGFGYARLRLPIELLIFILAAVFWKWYFESRQQVLAR